MNRLTDDDVERIARRVVGKLVVYGVVIVAAVWLAPIVIFALMNYVSRATSGMPAVVSVVLVAAVMAGPVVVLIWAWGRSKRAR